MLTRAEAYRSAWMKTAGRTFDASGQPILTEEERELVRIAHKLDFADAFRSAVSVKVAMTRLGMIFRGEVRP